MRQSFIWKICLACCAITWNTLAAAEPVEHLVIVSIDGMGVSYLDDPRAELPTLRELAAQGARAEGMITSFPSVTWPAHVSLITGVWPDRHGVIGNNVFDRDKNRQLAYVGDPELTKDQAVRVPTLYDAAHRAGLTSAAIIWPCCNGASTLNYVIPDSNKPELHARFTTPGLVDQLLKLGIDIRPIAEWGWDKQKANERDQLYAQVGCYLAEHQRVNLVLIHLITPDGVEHDHGPHTPPALAAVANSDQRVRQIWETLNRPPLAGKSTLFVVSDHGFAPYERRVFLNIALRQFGLLATDAEGMVTDRRAWSVAQGGCSFVYVLGNDEREQRVKSLMEQLAAVEGVERVILPEQYAELHFPASPVNAQVPDFIVTSAPGYAFNDSLAGDDVVVDAGGLKGSHGHLPQPEHMQAMFIAVGKGIRRGARVGVIQSIDVAPTAARLLGIQLPSAAGKVMDEILE